jgi:hypothetical protein
MNRNTTLILVIALGVLVLYVLLVQRPKDEAAASATPTPGVTTQRVWEVGNEQVTGFWLVEMSSGKSLAVTQDPQGGWRVTLPKDRPADLAQVTGAISRFTGLSVSTSITNPADLKPFGVLTPTYTLGVRLADGRQLRAAVGNLTATNSGYYVLRDGETEVLVINTAGITNLTGLLDAPPYFVPTPTPTPTVVLTFDVTATPAVTPTP